MALENADASIEKTKKTFNTVWIIDDSIPIHQASFDVTDMVEGESPIDRGTILFLMDKTIRWEEFPVRDLCKELIDKAENFLAFINPTSAVKYLKKGYLHPDIIVFDLGYHNKEDFSTVSENLETILKNSTSLVQIYTKNVPADKSSILDSIKTQYPTRFLDIVEKSKISSIELENLLSDKVKISLAAQISQKLRSIGSSAIERVLVKIDDLPIYKVIAMLAGNELKPEDSEIIEFISIKTQEAIANSPNIHDEIASYLKDKGLTEEKSIFAANEFVNVLTSTIKDNIQQDEWLLSIIKNAWKNQDTASVDEKTISDFNKFRLYDKPYDDLVRTGDILKCSDGKYILIITPACDLAKFWNKTIGTLTYVRIHPMTEEQGIPRITRYQNRIKSNVSNSITGSKLIWLPNVAISNSEELDMVIVPYEIGHFMCDQDNKVTDYYKSPLTYLQLSELKIGVDCERILKISEPYLSGILAALKDQLFRIGVPDMPDEVKKQLEKYDK